MEKSFKLEKNLQTNIELVLADLCRDELTKNAINELPELDRLMLGACYLFFTHDKEWSFFCTEFDNITASFNSVTKNLRCSLYRLETLGFLIIFHVNGKEFVKPSFRYKKLIKQGENIQPDHNPLNLDRIQMIRLYHESSVHQAGLSAGSVANPNKLYTEQIRDILLDSGFYRFNGCVKNNFFGEDWEWRP